MFQTLRLDARGGPSVPDRRAAHGGGRRRRADAGRLAREASAAARGAGHRWARPLARASAPTRSSTSRSTSPSKARRSPSGELRAILDGTDGLALVRGRWVEVDGERLRKVLDRWKTVEAAHAAGGHVRSSKGCGCSPALTSRKGRPRRAGGDVAAWSKVVAGESLAKALAGLRSPETLRRPRSRSVAARRAASLPEGRAPVALVAPRAWVSARCLADDMGLGKTLQVIALLVLLKKKGSAANDPSLLVVPASLLAQLARGDRALRSRPDCLRRSSLGGLAFGARSLTPEALLGPRTWSSRPTASLAARWPP